MRASTTTRTRSHQPANGLARARNRIGLRAALAACALLSTQPTLAENDTLRKTGDVLQFALPLTGLGATYLYDDKDGRWQLLKSAGANLATVGIMKEGVKKLRPNASEPNSYPSGHTNAAFFGAAFLNTRYGANWGIPAYALAALTGYSRVDADAHFADDVVAGASIALLWNWALVSPMSKQVALVPMQVADGYGIGLALSDASGEAAPRPRSAARPRFRFEYAFTSASLRENRVRGPGNSGTEFDLNNFAKIDDPTAAAIAELEWRFRERHALAIQLAMFESRDYGAFAQPTAFGGTTYASNTTVNSAYRSYAIPLIYRYDLLTEGRWIVRVGATLAPTFTSVSLNDGVNSSKVDDWGVALAPNVTLGVRLPHNFVLTADATGLAVSDDKWFEAGVRLTYQLSPNWELGGGYRRYEFRQDTNQLYNDVKYDAWQLAVAHRW